MVKNKYYVICALSLLLFCLSAPMATAETYIKNIETGEAKINIDPNEFPPAAYLYVIFKNNGDKNISNLTFEISYYDREGFLIKKAVVKNALNESIPKGGSVKQRIRLNCNAFNARNEQYPYSQRDKVSEFDIKILSAQSSRKP